MTNPDYTHWTLVVDRSGSMEQVRADAQGGINNAFAEQRKVPGKLTVSLIQFDDVIDTVHRMTPIAGLPDYTLIPRNMTALLDAVGKAIAETGEDLAALPEQERPAKVLLQVVTDGHENSSQEWDLPRIKELIARQKNDYGWEFSFIGAGEHAWAGRDMGMQASSHSHGRIGTRSAFSAASASLSQYRGPSGQSVGYSIPEVIEDEEEPSPHSHVITP